MAAVIVSRVHWPSGTPKHALPNRLLASKSAIAASRQTETVRPQVVLGTVCDVLVAAVVVVVVAMAVVVTIGVVDAKFADIDKFGVDDVIPLDENRQERLNIRIRAV